MEFQDIDERGTELKMKNSTLESARSSHSKTEKMEKILVLTPKPIQYGKKPCFKLNLQTSEIEKPEKDRNSDIAHQTLEMP